MWGRVLVAVMALACLLGAVSSTASADETGGVSGRAWFDRDENRGFGADFIGEVEPVMELFELSATGWVAGIATGSDGFVAI